MTDCPGKAIAYSYYYPSPIHCPGCAKRDQLRAQLAQLRQQCVCGAIELADLPEASSKKGLS